MYGQHAAATSKRAEVLNVESPKVETSKRLISPRLGFRGRLQSGVASKARSFIKGGRDG